MTTHLSTMSGVVWTAFAAGTFPSLNVPILAGTDRILHAVLMVSNLSGADDVGNYQATYGGQGSTARLYHRPSGRDEHWHHFEFLETAVAASTGSGSDRTLAITGNNNNGGYLIAWFEENVNQSNPYATRSFTDYFSGTQFQANFTGEAGKAQTAAWAHYGTKNRTLTEDPAWSSAAQLETTSPISADLGLSYDTGGNATFVLTSNLADTLPTTIFAVQTNSAVSAGLAVTSVNGDDVVRPDQTDKTQDGGPDNRVTIYATQASAVTEVRFGGVTQGQTGNGTLEVIDDGGGNYRLRFDADFDGATDFAYGLYTDGLALLGDPGGTVTHTVTLAPPEGNDYVTVAGYPPGAGISVLDLFNDAGYCTKWGISQAAAADGDLLEFETETDKGYTVSMAATGIPTIGGGQTTSQEFLMRILRANDSNQWSDYVPVRVNYQAVITSVNGVTGSSGKLDVLATNIPFVGDNFGIDFTDFELWAMPGKNTPLDTATGVRQNPLGTEITDASNTGFTLSAFNDGSGALTDGTYVTFWAVPGASP